VVRSGWREWCAGRRVLKGGELVDEAGLIHGPIDEGGLAVDEGAWDGAEVAAVAGDGTVVAHDEVFAFGDGHLGLGTVVLKLDGNVGFGERDAVDPDRSVVDAEVVSGKGDDSLDVALGAVLGIEEDDHVAAVDVLKAVGELVDEETILILEHGKHAGAFYADWLVEEEDDEHGNSDGDDQVARPGTPAGGLWWLNDGWRCNLR
jgi:hypothetical protein